MRVSKGVATEGISVYILPPPPRKSVCLRNFHVVVHLLWPRTDSISCNCAPSWLLPLTISRIVSTYTMRSLKGIVLVNSVFGCMTHATTDRQNGVFPKRPTRLCYLLTDLSRPIAWRRADLSPTRSATVVFVTARVSHFVSKGAEIRRPYGSDCVPSVN